MVKPDQLIKRRGKLGLVGVNLDVKGVKTWVGERMGKTIEVCQGVYSRFILTGLTGRLCGRHSQHLCG